MNIKSNLSGHWTDEQLVEHLYGIGPDAVHLDECSECRGRLNSMVCARRAVEASAAADEEVPSDLLAAQRRNVYAQIDRIQSWPPWLNVRRWAAVGAILALVGGGAALYEQVRQQELAQSRVTDAQLAQEVSQIASDSEPGSTAPLQALFDE